uniref:Serpin domain-containing protein n=1 Tax=Meloidogyne incognita TaxID=6306 RepID=A0A914MJ96_MELIC
MTKLNEKGTKAAAATFFELNFIREMNWEPPPPPKFVANHPFFFTINKGKKFLFCGIFKG